MTIRTLAAMTLALLLTACSGKPDVDELRQLVATELGASDPQAIFVIENFQKTNGYMKDERRYVAEVNYDLVFQKSLRDVAVEARNEPGGALLKMGTGMGLMALGLMYGDFKAGDRLHREQAVTLIKTEQGWRIDKE